MVRWLWAVCALGLSTGACREGGWTGAPRSAGPDRGPWVHRHPLPGDALRGLSGLAREPGPSGRFMTVAERLHHVVPVELGEDGALKSGPPIRVEGVDPELDLEGLTFLSDGRLVFATEADRKRTHEWLLFARREGDKIWIEDRVPFTYAPWNITPVRNKGLEGVCASSDQVVGVSEMVESEASRRWSPLGVYRIQDNTWRHFRVYLSSSSGKLSGLTCRSIPGGVEVTAIERHFDLLLVVRFVVPDTETAETVPALVPTVLANLRPRFKETPPNFEGLERVAGGQFLMITDNDWRGVRGPTELIFFEEEPPLGSLPARGATLGTALP